jgi:hypothetical protein
LTSVFLGPRTQSALADEASSSARATSLPPRIASPAETAASGASTWDAPSISEQLERDGTLVPPGKGAIFVPSMTDPRLEPPWLILRDGKVIQTATPGHRAVVDAGIYEIRIGSGGLLERLVRKVLVKDGRTTTVPATWSGLVVAVVDDRSTPFRGSYELLRLPERRNMGMGLGADIELGEEVRTWILEPGSYLLIKAGENAQARRDFFTFRLQPGELSTVTLVMNREDGSFMGAGQIEILRRRSFLPKDWRLHLVLGADAEFNRRSDVVGFPSGYGFTLGGYLDFLAQYKPRKHYVYLRLKLEEKQIKVPDHPFQKDLDEMKFDALYVYRALPWLGPYIRVGSSTALFPGYVYLDDKTELLEVDAKGQTLRSLGTHEGNYLISRSGAPSQIKAGGGLGFLITGSYWLDANLRIGIGGRALYTRKTLSPVTFNDSPRTLTVRRLGDAYQYGAEATLVATLRISRWILAATDLEILEPFTDWRHPIVEWDNSVGIRIASFLSVNYIFRLLSDKDRSEHLQTEHRVLLRFSWQIL